jgi:hypothetical protein
VLVKRVLKDMKAKRLESNKVGCEETVTKSDPENGCFQVDGIRWSGFKVLRMKRVI